MKDKKPVGTIINSAILDPMPGTSKTREIDTMAVIKRNKLRDPEQLTGRYEIRPLVDPERTAATTDLVKTTPESIRKSWGLPPVDPQLAEYMAGLEKIYHLPDTIEDEIPPVSEAFAKKVKEMGGVMTAFGLICDPRMPVTGKRYMRIARAFFTHMFNDSMRHVEDAEFRIRNYGTRNKKTPDWENMTGNFIKCLQAAIKMRHQPGRKPVYALKVNVPARDLIMLEKAGEYPLTSPFKE